MEMSHYGNLRDGTIGEEGGGGKRRRRLHEVRKGKLVGEGEVEKEEMTERERQEPTFPWLNMEGGKEGKEKEGDDTEGGKG